jgi:tetratricopeptide (TPR) repeat protein
VRVLGRIAAIVLSLPLLLLGAAGLLFAHGPEAMVSGTAVPALRSFVLSLDAAGVPHALAALNAGTLQAWLASPAFGGVCLLPGLLLLFVGLRRSGASDQSSGAATPLGSPDSGVIPVDKRTSKRAVKQASLLAKNGDVEAAAELLFDHGVLDKSAGYFEQAGQFVRAAEIKHDQNLFLDSADLYIKAGRFDSAGSIFRQQKEYARAAECYLEADSKSVAAEMFEEAKDFRRAADCFREVGFMRHAAQAYVKCKAWAKAAACLEEVYTEESMRVGHADPKRLSDLRKMVRQAGKLYDRAKLPEKALGILEKGGCSSEAAQAALTLRRFAKAAELFQEAGDPTRAAEALRELGENEEAARILGEHHRDCGDTKEAAHFLEEAGDFASAGELYRQLEEYGRAAECFERQPDHAQAAEMFKMAGDRARAADCYEHAHQFTEAAECCGLIGDTGREAGLLERAGDFLRAGEAFQREGVDEEAIRVLQQVEASNPGFARASALLGEIFQARGQLSLAINKLKQAIGDQDLTRESLPVYYTLATIYDSNQQCGEAVEIYEKILALDYHYADVEQRLLAAKQNVQHQAPLLESSAQETGSSRGFGAGTVSGRYQVVGELGRGGMGIVYKAKDTVLDRLVAYKVLPDTLKENPQALANFLREAKAAAKLNHPNIVTVYDAGEQDGRYYIAMEYVDGTTLKEIVRSREAISPSSVLHVAAQICEALAYAHEKKVVHRDIKTANAMWTRDKKAKIMDFGLARVTEEFRNHTTVVSGTPYYMSPEQTLGKNIDHRTDIYSLGVTIFEMATGKVPFREGNIPYHHVHTPPPDVRELRPELPPELAAIVGKCMSKDPAARYQSAREILVDIKALLAHANAQRS